MSAKKPITTALLPVAGLGTRFLPVTKASPKEMMPILDKPLIQFAINEAAEAGIKQIVLITSYAKRPIEDYFDNNYELEERLQQAGKVQELQKLRDIAPKDMSFVYVRQSEPLGLGDAILQARSIVGEQDFAILLADEILHSAGAGCLAQMHDTYKQSGNPVIAVEAVPEENVSSYGIAAVDQGNIIRELVEKPQPSEAPSNLAVIGRYILPAKVFTYLASSERGYGGEIQLTDAISKILPECNLFAHNFVGQRFDCGNPLGCLKAGIHFALQREDTAEKLREFLKHTK